MSDEAATTNVTRTILADLLNEIRASRPTQCGAPPAVMQEHTAMLYEIRGDIKALVSTVAELKDDFKTHKDDIYEKVNEHQDDLTAIKTDKKTAIALGGTALTAIGSIAWAIFEHLIKK